LRHAPVVSNIHQSKNFIHDRAFYESPFWERLSKQCRQRARYTCKLCGKRAKNQHEKKRFHADHIIPRSRGGEDAIHNLRCICENCHGKQHPHLARAIAKREAAEVGKNNSVVIRPAAAFRPARVNQKKLPGAPAVHRSRATTKSRLY